MRIYTILNAMVDKLLEEESSDVILERLYPVNSIYMSITSTSPALLFGGTWEQIVGKFARAHTDTSTGGADTVTLTTAQIPSHTHTYNWPNWTGTNGSAGNGFAYVGNTKWQTSGAAGGSSAHNNMPAYQDVYAWRRIA